MEQEATVEVKRQESDGRNSSSLDHDRCDNGPLSCFGCGLGWFCFILGFIIPPLWYYATYLYFQDYYLKEPRERSGLAASAITALLFSAILFIAAVVVLASTSFT